MNNNKIVFRIQVIIFVLLCIAPSIYTKEPVLPKVNILSVKRIFYNGEHNSFTDLCKFNEKYYLAFRSCPDGHMVFPSSSIIIMSSEDGQKWEQVHRFSVADRDTRDPHFLIFKDKLFVYTGTWYCESDYPVSKNRDLNQHLGYCVWTHDGQEWHRPVMLEGTYGHYIWRAAAYKDCAYLCGRRKHQFAVKKYDDSDGITESAMLMSSDGFIFSKKALFQENDGDETAFVFEDDGEVVAVARRSMGNAEICRSKPPYTEWERNDLGRYIGGPLLVKWNGRYFVGGRKMLAEDVPRTAFYWLVNGILYEAFELPSGGDSSYPGFVALPDNRALVSYYSSHEKDESGQPITAIYLATLEIRQSQ